MNIAGSNGFCGLRHGLRIVIIAMKHLDLLKLEDVRNLVSESRVMADFVGKLPEIASSLKIDRHTVFDASGASPLAQILSILEEYGLGRFFEERK